MSELQKKPMLYGLARVRDPFSQVRMMDVTEVSKVIYKTGPVPP